MRLPARSPCSSWRTLISSSQFANDHVRRLIASDPSLSEPRVFYHYGQGYESRRYGNFSVRTLLENPSPPTELVRLRRRGEHLIMGSCNGLMCLLEININNCRVRLWNPCTRLMTSKSLEIGGYWLSVWGFGYDHVNDKYKLAGVLNPKSSTRIYTFGSKASWRTIQDFPVNSIVGGDLEGVFVPGTGALNWIRQDATLKRLVFFLDLA
ncbi:hypothetical protein PIB30_079322 [Stylosanthes scabra]|uniref:F-box associated beta-propeller type 3 domain-containing protein n=1 Tax=Stylosanthes scabra TaxID=79078 RepID=A0ABU6SRI9_9FABA|nr:hypothetical protein [Stylosanthes scabra]